MGTGALASQGGVGAQLRVKIGAGNAELRAGFLQARGGRGQILILGPDRRFEPVQFRFAKNFPPRAARQSGGRPRGFPVANIVGGTGHREGVRHRLRLERNRTLIIRSHRATGNNGEGAGSNEADAPGPRFVNGVHLFEADSHFSATSVGSAMRTVVPEASPSGGFTITRSPASTPLKTSTSDPKSRPILMVRTSTLLLASTTPTCIPSERKRSVLAGSVSDGFPRVSSKRTCA